MGARSNWNLNPVAWRDRVRACAHVLSIRVANGELTGPDVELAILDLVQRAAEARVRHEVRAAVREDACCEQNGTRPTGDRTHRTQSVRECAQEKAMSLAGWRGTDEDAHLRSIVDLYRSDPMAMADALWRMREQIGALRLAAEEAQR